MELNLEDTFKNAVRCVLAGITLAHICAGMAATLYVDVAARNPVWPYTNGWAAAATTIQAAIDAANDRDLILVTDGVYRNGARALYGSNRVRTDRGIRPSEVQGRWVCTRCGALI